MINYSKISLKIKQIIKIKCLQSKISLNYIFKVKKIFNNLIKDIIAVILKLKRFEFIYLQNLDLNCDINDLKCYGVGYSLFFGLIKLCIQSLIIIFLIIGIFGVIY